MCHLEEWVIGHTRSSKSRLQQRERAHGSMYLILLQDSGTNEGKFVHEHTHREQPFRSSQLLAQLQINYRPINSSPVLSRLQLIRLWTQKLYHRHRWSAQLCPRCWWEGDRVIVLWLAQQRGRFRRLPVKYNYRVRVINDQWRNTVYPRKCLKDWDSKVQLGWNQGCQLCLNVSDWGWHTAGMRGGQA